jgi:hypothetical protein
MELIMAKLTVKKEFIESEVHFDSNGSSLKVILKNASQEQLKLVQLAGVDVFEKPEKEK